MNVALLLMLVQGTQDHCDSENRALKQCKIESSLYYVVKPSAEHLLLNQLDAGSTL